MGQIICANKGIRYIDQPFTTFKSKTVLGQISADKKSLYLPPLDQSQLISLSSSAEKQIASYMNLLLPGKISLNTPLEYSISKKYFGFLTNRTMIKITGASAMIDWFVYQFDCQVIYLIRHPIPNVLSIMRNKWGITASAYLNDQEFTDSYMDNDVLEFSWHIMKSDDFFLQGILNWCLENLVPLKFSNSKFLTITYEEMVLSPIQMVELLTKYLNVSHSEKMFHAVGKPSASSGFSEECTVKDIQSPQSRAERYEKIVARWEKSISEEKEKQAMGILDAFGIHAYCLGSSLPHKFFLHFPALLHEFVDPQADF